MSGRQSMAVFNAVQAVVWGMAQTITQAAKTHGCAVSSVRRALRAAGVEPRKGGRPANGPPEIAYVVKGVNLYRTHDGKLVTKIGRAS